MAKGKSGKRGKVKRAARKPAAGDPPSPRAVAGDEAPAAAAASSDAAPELPRDEPAPVRGQPVPGAVVLLRRLDDGLGLLEHALLAVLVVALIATAMLQTIYGNLFNREIVWSSEVIRYGVFFIATTGAALAAQKRRMISMDVLTRLMGPSRKAITRIFVALLVIFLCGLLVKGGVVFSQKAGLREDYVLIDPGKGALALPISAAVIALHYAIHLAIDAIYLLSGRTPPEADAMPVH